MRILIDMQGAQTESRFRGIGRYSTSLAQAMVRNCGDHEIWLVANATLRDGIPELYQAMEGLLPRNRIQVFDSLSQVGWPNPANGWRRGAAELAREAFIANLQPDVIHVSSLFEGSQDAAITSIGKLPCGPRVAVTLYDLIPLLNSDVYLSSDWTRSWYMDKIDSLKRADLLLAISEHARNEAIDTLGIDPGRVINMSSAISPHFKKLRIGDAEQRALREKFGVCGSFVMYSGAMEPRKNTDRLLQAFAQLPTSLRQVTQLVIAGKVAPHDMARLGALARECGVEDQVSFTGYVSDEDLILLYSAASVYVFPSLHEGFGLPALEAMACGAPTIGSRTTSVPEVIGRSDALFDPTDVGQIAGSIQRVLTDHDFAESLRQHASTHAASFSWDRSARTALSAFERLHAQGASSTRVWSMARVCLATNHEALIAGISSLSYDVLPSESEMSSVAKAIAVNQARAEQIAREGELPEVLRWRVEGPFDTSYSLALVNRELARALSDLGHDVALHSTEGPGDFAANREFLRLNPDVATLHARERSLTADSADVSSRLLYPPRVRDMRSRMNLLHLYAWEESGFPQGWVEEFNAYLQGVSCLSSHVQKILLDNGVAVPLASGGCGVDHWERIHSDEGYPLEARSFRFLHVSSCFPRKGADVLLKAYGAAFSNRDDVSLVIKTFANPHNQIHKWLAEARQDRTDFPHVVVIEDDLSDAQLKGLYERCEVLVAPSRAEGFGLPLAEAMLSGLQVITTAWGGQRDFCNERTAWLVDYDFAPARTHFDIPGSAWAEPSMESLAQAMRDVRSAEPAELARKSERARQILAGAFKWTQVAARVEGSLRRFSRSIALQTPSVGWITTWNTRCGIASYSGYLAESFGTKVTILAAEAEVRTFEDDADVVRCWRQGDGEELDTLDRVIQEQRLEALVIQFQYSFFDFPVFAEFLRAQKEAGRIIVVMMHATADSPLTPRKQLARLAESLALCDRVLVHSIADLNRLKAIGLVENVALFPHGVLEAPEVQVDRGQGSARIVSSYGFFLPHKGLHELIEAVALLRKRGIDVRLNMFNAEYPVPESRAQIERARDRIRELGLQQHVSLVTDFLRDDEALAGLAASDLIVFPYQVTGESSSAAVRNGLASGRPVAVTPLSIFDDVVHVTHRLPGGDPLCLADGIASLLAEIDADAPSIRETSQAARQWRGTNRYPAVAHRLFNILRQLHSAHVSLT